MCHLPDGHYEIPLPVKDKNLTLPNNCAMALNRLKSPLKRNFHSSESYHQHYVEFTNKVIQNRHTERVPEDKVSEVSNKLEYTNLKKPTRSGWCLTVLHSLRASR